jgi:hypothetical protein
LRRSGLGVSAYMPRVYHRRCGLYHYTARTQQGSRLQTTGVKRKLLDHPPAELVRRLYDARTRDDEEGIRSCLARDIVWHEPDLASEHTGELAGPGAVC